MGRCRGRQPGVKSARPVNKCPAYGALRAVDRARLSSTAHFEPHLEPTRGANADLLEARGFLVFEAHLYGFSRKMTPGVYWHEGCG